MKYVAQLFKKSWLISLLSVGVILFFLYHAFYYQLHGSMFFYTDPGRDMLLLDDLSKEGISLIGARTSLSGIFHGPLWMYLNLPAFLLGNGNPLVMGWFIAGVAVVFLITLFYMVRDLFNTTSALIATVLMSSALVFFMEYYTNPLAALFIMPVFIYTILKYVKTRRLVYLLAHFFIGGCLVHFEMMIGVPMLILSTLYLLKLVYSSRQYLHLVSPLVALLPLSTFVLFDVRHDFIQFRSLLDYVTNKNEQFGHKPLNTIIMQRVDIVLSGGSALFLHSPYKSLSVLSTVLFGNFLVQHKKTKQEALILSMVYYFVGYMLLTFVLKDTLLFHYYYPLTPLVIMAFAALYKSAAKPLYTAVVVLSLLLSAVGARAHGEEAQQNIGQIEDDWKFLSTVAETVFSGEEDTLGYYIYAPDIFAYEQKYAVLYQKNMHPEKEAAIFEKRPVTYLVIAPEVGTGEMLIKDWKTQKVRINRPADEVFTFEAGYVVEKYYLTPEELAVPSDPTMDDGIYFR